MDKITLKLWVWWTWNVAYLPRKLAQPHLSLSRWQIEKWDEGSAQQGHFFFKSSKVFSTLSVSFIFLFKSCTKKLSGGERWELTWDEQKTCQTQNSWTSLNELVNCKNQFSQNCLKIFSYRNKVTLFFFIEVLSIIFCT